VCVCVHMFWCFACDLSCTASSTRWRRNTITTSIEVEFKEPLGSDEEEESEP